MADEVKTTLSDSDVENVQGGAGSWEQFAKGTYFIVGDHIIYTIAMGDALSGIAIRFGVSVPEIQVWNNIANPNMIIAGKTLIIYPKILR